MWSRAGDGPAEATGRRGAADTAWATWELMQCVARGTRAFPPRSGALEDSRVHSRRAGFGGGACRAATRRDWLS